MRAANMIHMMTSATTPTPQKTPRVGCRFEVTWMKAWPNPRRHENPLQGDEQMVGLARQERQRDEREEQNRDFELIAERIADQLFAPGISAAMVGVNQCGA